MASCEATCSGSCDAECEGTPPSASCEAKCESSCSGSCEAEANLECQVECQTDGYLECTGRVTGGCEAACDTEEGALFCDGQYVDYGDNLDECVNALKDLFNIEVEGYASAECEGNMCEAEAGGSASCAAGGARGGFGAAGWILLGFAFAGRALRRRRVG